MSLRHPLIFPYIYKRGFPSFIWTLLTLTQFLLKLLGNMLNNNLKLVSI